MVELLLLVTTQHLFPPPSLPLSLALPLNGPSMYLYVVAAYQLGFESRVVVASYTLCHADDDDGGGDADDYDDECNCI